jgi:hypothetical protein
MKFKPFGSKAQKTKDQISDCKLVQTVCPTGIFEVTSLEVVATTQFTITDPSFQQSQPLKSNLQKDSETVSSLNSFLASLLQLKMEELTTNVLNRNDFARATYG